MPASIIRSFPSFVHVSLPDRPNSVCWICFWSGVGRGDGSKPMDDNAPTPRISSRKSVPSAAPCGLRVSMVYVLNVLSEVAPDWIRTHIPAEWVKRYGHRLEEERLPKEEQERKQYANQV